MNDEEARGVSSADGLTEEARQRRPLDIDIVVPTVGRPSLARLLTSLAAATGPQPRRVVLVDDRRTPRGPLPAEPVPDRIAERLVVVASGGRGPAAARNRGWRAADAPWIAFLDDDVEVRCDWLTRLADDLDGLAAEVAGSQGHIVVPLGPGLRPTDFQRDVAGLERARWATADMAYRRVALAAVGGFDEGFPRAYREDADLGLRLQADGWRLVRGRRTVRHPVAAGGLWVSVRRQAGNADDPRMRRRHGRAWRTRAEAPPGRRHRHVAVTAAAAAAMVAAGARRRNLATAAALAWLAGTAEFTVARVRPGPRDASEVLRMVATSVAIPPVATAWWLAGWVRAARAPVETAVPRHSSVDAVLLDRDGTLVHDEPYNGDPDLVRPLDGAAEALARLRAGGLRLGLVTNQSGIARGVLTPAQVDAVNDRVATLLGPLDTIQVCPHGPDDGCRCRKPAAGLVVQAAAALGVAPWRCAVIGDIGVDVEAARAAGARGILVPTAATRLDEVEAAAEVAPTLAAAVNRLVGAAR